METEPGLGSRVEAQPQGSQHHPGAAPPPFLPKETSLLSCPDLGRLSWGPVLQEGKRRPRRGEAEVSVSDHWGRGTRRRKFEMRSVSSPGLEPLEVAVRKGRKPMWTGPS